jgi:hypothetical protein
MNRGVLAIQSLIEEQTDNYAKLMPMEIPMSKWGASVPSPFDNARGLIDRKYLHPSMVLHPLKLLNNPPNTSQILGSSSFSTASSQVSVDEHSGFYKSGAYKSVDQKPGVVDQKPGAHKSVDQKPVAHKFSGARFKCICGLFFESKDDFYQHYGNKCPSLSNACDKCERRFVRRQDLSRHQLMSHGPMVLSCQGCNNKFTKTKSLHRHQLYCKRL